VHVGDCLSTLAVQAERESLRVALETVQIQVMSGFRLSACIAKQDQFSNFEAQCLASGEEGGFLHATLEGLAEHWEQVSRLQHQLRQQLIYPTFVVVMAVVCVLVLPSLLHRSLQPLFQQSGGEMPLLARFFSGLACLAGHPLSWLGMVLVAWALLTFWLRLATGQRERLLESIPLVGPIWQGFATVTFLKTLHLTLKAGLPVLKSLIAAAAASGSEQTLEAAGLACRDLRDGKTLSQALDHPRLAPSWLAGFFRAGEESGSLEQLVFRGARILEEDLLSRVEQLLALLQPAVVVFLGCVVALMALGILLPISKVLETL